MLAPLWLQALGWGLLSGSALLIGAAAGTFLRVSPRFIAGVMAFGAGVLVSALSFELMDEAFKVGGLIATASGFLVGASLYSGANWLLSQQGARHRKRSGHNEQRAQPNENEQSGSGLAIAVGALLDGIPESIVIGLSLLGGGAVSWVAVTAVFLSNLPEGLSSASGMLRAGRSKSYVFGIWGSIALLSGLSSLLGYAAFGASSPAIVAAITASAAGAILAMLADTMIPEAFEGAHEFAGIFTVAGFLCAFTLSKIGG